MASSSTIDPTDIGHMGTALVLARRGLGRCAPNPSVGCVITDTAGQVVGRGVTAPGGRPHAEVQALAMAGAAARGGTAYVTLEPCSHTGRTPPCAQALIDAGVARVVIACGDPDPRVDGAGIAMLRAAGIAVTDGVLEAEAQALNAGFFLTRTAARPLFALKVAASLDGGIATASGHSQWITGEAARAAGHLLRAEHDAILIGRGTAQADDPTLTCRMPGAQRTDQPVRVVLDSGATLPLASRLVQSVAQAPVVVIAGAGAESARREALEAAGVRVLQTQADTVTAQETAHLLHTELGLTRVLIEGGPSVATAFLAADLVDILYWFAAPTLLGSDAMSAVQKLGLARVSDAPMFRAGTPQRIGGDTLTVFHRRDPA